MVIARSVPRQVSRSLCGAPPSAPAPVGYGSTVKARVAYQDPAETTVDIESEDVLVAEIPDVLPADFSASVSEEFAREAAISELSTAESPSAELSGSLKGMLFLNLGAMLFGSNQVVIKTCEEALSPVALDALRFGAAALCFLPLLPRALKQREMIWPAVELGIWLTAGYTAQAFGLSMTSASHGAFTGTFTVLAVPLLMGLSGRKIAGKTWVAGAAALLGVSLLTTSEGDPNWGDAVCIFSAVLFGVHKWRSETITARVADTPSLVALQLVVLAGTSVLLAVPEMAAFFSANGDAQIPAAIDALANFPWPNIFFMGVGTTALTLYIEMDSLKEVSAAMAALIYTTEPLWGAAFAWMLLDERWGTQGWIGAALIVTASFASQLSGDIEDKEESHAVKKEA